MACVAGVCTCPTGQTNCSGTCVDEQTNAGHCGGCTTACLAGESCTGGKCSCPTGQTLCTTDCTNTSEDPANCGGCGVACAPGQSCVSGTCECPSGQRLCGNGAGACTATLTDPANCGTCGNVCPAGDVCSNGACAVSCQAGLTKCGGACVNLADDPGNCGACGATCNLAHATAACAASTCQVIACNAGYGNCDGAPANGCESNLGTDTSNCGHCGLACGTPANSAPPTCSGGACTLGTCNANDYNSNGLYADGCECTARGVTNACSGAVLVTAPAEIAGRILPPLSTQQWYQVTFPNESGRCGAVYQIELVNDGNPIAMTVYQNCTGTGVACGGGEPTSGYTSWQLNNSDTGFAPPPPPLLPACTDTSPTVYDVEVFATGAATTCMDYTLVITAD
jgi:hypothetical protein